MGRQKCRMAINLLQIRILKNGICLDYFFACNILVIIPKLYTADYWGENSPEIWRIIWSSVFAQGSVQQYQQSRQQAGSNTKSKLHIINALSHKMYQSPLPLCMLSLPTALKIFSQGNSFVRFVLLSAE